jgi:hypothetical protein
MYLQAAQALILWSWVGLGYTPWGRQVLGPSYLLANVPFTTPFDRGGQKEKEFIGSTSRAVINWHF